MATMCYFLDGSKEVLLSGDNQEAAAEELERILWERLGGDVVELYHRSITQPMGDNYELIAESYRMCLQDALESVESALALLETPRSDRRKVARMLKQTIETINNEI